MHIILKAGVTIIYMYIALMKGTWFEAIIINERFVI